MFKQLLATGLALGSTFAIASTAYAGTRYGQIIENAKLGQGFQARDYTIHRSGKNTTVGNGVDESVSWTFDFTKEQSLLDTFLADDSALTSAELIFSDILITDKKVTTDLFGIPGYSGMRFSSGTRNGSALINLLSATDVPVVGETVSFSVNLLDYGLSAEAIMGTFLDDTDHTNSWYKSDSWVGELSDYTIANDKYAIPFIYMDDAIIRESKLVLRKQESSLSATARAVPEPAAVASLIGIGGSLLMRRCKQQAQ